MPRWPTSTVELCARAAAVRVIEEEAIKANPNAINAINAMGQLPDSALAIQSLGKLAANGNNDA